MRFAEFAPSWRLGARDNPPQASTLSSPDRGWACYSSRERTRATTNGKTNTRTDIAFCKAKAIRPLPC